MKKILMIICCLMMSLGISAQKNFVYGIYDVQTKKGVGGSYIIDLKNKKFLPDCDGGEYSDCGDMKNVKTVGDVTTFDWYNSDGSFGGRGKVGKLKDGRMTFSVSYGKGSKLCSPMAMGTEREQHAFEEEGMVGLQKAGVLNKGIDSVKNLFKKKDKKDKDEAKSDKNKSTKKK